MRTRSSSRSAKLRLSKLCRQDPRRRQQPADYQARCLQWGVDNEGNAAQAYLAAMQQSFPTSGYSLKECSLSVLSGHPHVAASPDRLILINGQPDGLLECKCPYSAEVPEQCPQEYRIQVLAQLACHPQSAQLRYGHVYVWEPSGAALFVVP